MTCESVTKDTTRLKHPNLMKKTINFIQKHNQTF